jgi:hypothetical protein
MYFVGLEVKAGGVLYSAESATPARFSARRFPSFPQNEGNNHKGSDRIGPPEMPNRIASKANQSDQGKVTA